MQSPPPAISARGYERAARPPPPPPPPPQPLASPRDFSSPKRHSPPPEFTWNLLHLGETLARYEQGDIKRWGVGDSLRRGKLPRHLARRPGVPLNSRRGALKPVAGLNLSNLQTIFPFSGEYLLRPGGYVRGRINLAVTTRRICARNKVGPRMDAPTGRKCTVLRPTRHVISVLPREICWLALPLSKFVALIKERNALQSYCVISLRKKNASSKVSCIKRALTVLRGCFGPAGVFWPFLGSFFAKKI